MSNRIITISREFGSGGRTIGRQAAEKLGISCYDQELIEKMVQESGFSPDYIKEKSEYAPHNSWLSHAFSGRSMEGFSNEDLLWNLQVKIINEIAEQESCVIVGRCADYILRGKADLLTVFIHADLSYREERIVKVYGDSDELLEKRLRSKDKRRQAYYQFYTDMKWGEACNYHISLDSGVLGIERCTELIAGLY